jgi:U3 small nucleolar RNA-associated protein 20
LALLQLSVSLLVAGDSSFWATAGREIIARSWETDVAFAVELSSSLCELGWGGWKSFCLPSILKHTHRALETAPTETLRLLAWSVEEQKLTTVDAVWKQRVEGWIEKRLLAVNWRGSEEDVSGWLSPGASLG